MNTHKCVSNARTKIGKTEWTTIMNLIRGCNEMNVEIWRIMRKVSKYLWLWNSFSGPLHSFSCNTLTLIRCIGRSSSRRWGPCHIPCVELVIFYQFRTAFQAFFVLPLIIFRPEFFPPDQVLDLCTPSPLQHSFSDNSFNFPFSFQIIHSPYYWRRGRSCPFEWVFASWSWIQINHWDDGSNLPVDW